MEQSSIPKQKAGESYFKAQNSNQSNRSEHKAGRRSGFPSINREQTSISEEKVSSCRISEQKNGAEYYLRVKPGRSVSFQSTKVGEEQLLLAGTREESNICEQKAGSRVVAQTNKFFLCA